jgi:hypothetical protein
MLTVECSNGLFVAVTVVPVRRCGGIGCEVVAALPRDWVGNAGQDEGHRKRVLEPHRTFIKQRIAQTPHLTLHRLKDELAARGINVSHNVVWLFLRREGLSFKKNAVRP